MSAHVAPMTAGRRVLPGRVVCREGPWIKRGRGKVFLGGYRRLASHLLADVLIQAVGSGCRKSQGWVLAITGRTVVRPGGFHRRSTLDTHRAPARHPTPAAPCVPDASAAPCCRSARTCV